MDNYGFIYMTHNLVNGKMYIGKKKYDADGRWVNYLGSGILLSRAIKKYGKENFAREIIDTACSRDELCEKEKYWIKYYNATCNTDFYNIAPGGDGGNVRDGYSDEQLKISEQKRIEAVRRGISRGEQSGTSKLSDDEVRVIVDELCSGQYVSTVAHKHGIAVSTVGDIKNHRTWCHITNGITFPHADKRFGSQRCAKKIDVYDKQMNFIGSYDSARDAEADLGVGYRLISQVCTGEKKSSHGYIFKFSCQENT